MLSGICLTDDRQAMLCISNPSYDAIVIERGDVIALGYPVPDGTKLERRRKMPEEDRGETSLVFSDGEWSQCGKGHGDESLAFNDGEWSPCDAAHALDEMQEDSRTNVGVSFPLREGDEAVLRAGEEAASRTETGGFVEKLYHLVQDEDRIRHIHTDEVPPSEY